MRTLFIALACVACEAAIATQSGLVGYWNFNEGSGTVIHDLSGFGNDGVLVNATASTWTTSGFGGALSFGGVTGSGSTRVEIADSASLRLSNSFTFAAMVNCQNVFRDAPIFAKEGPGGALSYWFGNFGASGAGHWGALLDQDGNQSWDFNGRDQGNCPANVWVHLATTWDGHTVSYYMNGELTNTTSWNGTIHASDARLFIGSNSEYTFQGNATAYEGSLDELRIYNTALSAGEIRALVPEPSAAAILGLGALLLIRRKRR